MTMSRVLRVSRSDYYTWLKWPPGLRVSRQAHRNGLIEQAFEHRKGRSESPNITRDLHEQGHRCDRKSVAASMRRQGLRAKAVKKFKVTTDSKHHLPVAPNHLDQDFSAAQPNQKWVGAISRVCGQMKAGCIWLSSSICSRER